MIWKMIFLGSINSNWALRSFHDESQNNLQDIVHLEVTLLPGTKEIILKVNTILTLEAVKNFVVRHRSADHLLIVNGKRVAISKTRNWKPHWPILMNMAVVPAILNVVNTQNSPFPLWLKTVNSTYHKSNLHLI